MPQRCHRCLQPVASGARRCPHCGDKLKADARNVSLTLGVMGLIILVAIIGFGLFLASNPEPPADDDPDGQTTSTPAPPPKKPPLN